MPKSRLKKQSEVKKLEDNLSQAKAMVFANFAGLTVAESQALRRQLKKSGVTFQVAKKTLIKKVFEDKNFAKIDLDSLKDNVGVAFGQENEISPAKELFVFAKDHQKLKLAFGFLEGKIIDSEKIKELAQLPSRLELIAKTVGSIKAPLSGLVNVMVGNLRGLVNVLVAIKNNK